MERKTVAVAGCSEFVLPGRSAPAAEKGERILPGVPSNPAQRLRKVATQLLDINIVIDTRYIAAEIFHQY